MKREAAKHIADETRNSYDNMAREFSDSRARFWDELAFLALEIKAGDHVLDMGCGNGRFAPLVIAHEASYVGLDYSRGLITEAERKFPEQVFTVGDATALPFPDSSFDIVFSFAVIHHIPSKDMRKQFIAEAFRVLRPGGKFIFTAWDLWSPQYMGKIVVSALSSLLGKDNLDMGDAMLTFGKQKHPRYVHACTMRELCRMLAEAGFHVSLSERIARKSGQKNIVIIAQKPVTK